jgi:3-dehydroquinate dehydratase-2
MSSMTQTIYVLNGPNLNRLGTREPQIYGTTTLAGIEALCRAAAGPHPIEFRQSNAESQLIDWIHEAIDHGAGGIVINAAGLTFSSVPIVDALKMFAGPVIELHITNIHRREAMYQNSLISKVATGIVMGLGADGYRVAIDALVRRLASSRAAS